MFKSVGLTCSADYTSIAALADLKHVRSVYGIDDEGQVRLCTVVLVDDLLHLPRMCVKKSGRRQIAVHRQNMQHVFNLHTHCCDKDQIW